MTLAFDSCIVFVARRLACCHWLFSVLANLLSVCGPSCVAVLLLLLLLSARVCAGSRRGDH